MNRNNDQSPYEEPEARTSTEEERLAQSPSVLAGQTHPPTEFAAVLEAQLAQRAQRPHRLRRASLLGHADRAESGTPRERTETVIGHHQPDRSILSFWHLPRGAVEAGESHIVPITRERRTMPGNRRRVAAILATLALLGLTGILAAPQWLGMLMQTGRPGPISEPASMPNSADALAGLSLARGITWVYAYVPYEPTVADATQIVTATYRLTETVVDTGVAPPYFVAHVQRTQSLVEAQPDWPDETSSQPIEYWYLVRGHQVYQSFERLNWTNLPTTTLILAYDLPLTVGGSWCPGSMVKDEPVQDCTTAGQRTVISHGSYATPAGRFDDCYQIAEAVNSGGVTRWFCTGIGVVAQTYDHAGTRFGFTQVLQAYVRGGP